MVFIDKFGSKILYYRSKTDYGYTEPNLSDKHEVVLTQNMGLYKDYQNRNYDVHLLSSYFGLSDTIGLYEIYSYFFDGNVESDFDMLELIFNGLFLKSDFCFCLNIDATFCWFVVTQQGIKILGTMQYSYTASKYTMGKFIKKLRYAIAKSGYNLNCVTYLFWSEKDLLIDIENYITKRFYLDEFFGKINGMKGMNCMNVMQLLDTEIKETYRVTAKDFLECLNKSFNKLKIYEKDGILYSGNTFYKDYSTCISPIINPNECNYGIILDCEGKSSGILQDGGRQFGGLIFCKYKNILLNLDTFICDEVLLEETILKVFDNYKLLTNLSLFKNKPIDILVYGTSDELLFTTSLHNVCSKKNIRNIIKNIHFVNVYDYINEYLMLNKPLDSKHTLDNVARFLNVQVVQPLHNPSNDARTLFNVLARILQITKKFVV